MTAMLLPVPCPGRLLPAQRPGPFDLRQGMLRAAIVIGTAAGLRRRCLQALTTTTAWQHGIQKGPGSSYHTRPGSC
jgi:hypothetical protein